MRNSNITALRRVDEPVAGAKGELTVNTPGTRLYLHDGVTPGGVQVALITYGFTRPIPTSIGQLHIDLSMGPLGQLIYAAQVTPTVVWANTAGVQV